MYIYYVFVSLVHGYTTGTQTTISPGFFSGGLGKCSKLKAKLKVKNGAQPVFKKKRNVPFAAREQINKELDRLEESGILSKTDFSEWAAPKVHIKKKSNQIRICADFSTGLNDTLQDHHNPLPSPEEIFNKLNIKNMQNLRGPLNELLKKDKPWLWTTECQESFEKIKKTLNSGLSLTHFDPTLDIIVASDASSYGICACILHKLPDGSRKAVAHASRSLLPAENQYSQIEKETLGIIFAVTKFHRYLHRRRFILQTDHKPLITIFGSKKGLPVYTAKRLLRWGTILLNYNFKIEFLTSKNICHANSLSRLVPKNTEVFEDSIIATLRRNLRNQQQCSQEKSSPSSINSFHGKQSSRKPSRPIRNISILAIKFFSRPTKTTWHSEK